MTDSAPQAALRVACVTGVQPATWQRRWVDNRPDVKTDWFFISTDDQWAWLEEGRCDVLFARVACEQSCEQERVALSYPLPDPPHGVHPRHNDQFSCVRLYQETPVLIAAQQHESALVDTITLEDLAALEDPRIGSGDLRLSSEQIDHLFVYAGSGAGIGIVPGPVARHAKDGAGRQFRGTIRPLESDPLTEVCLVWHRAQAPHDPQESIIQDYVGTLRGRRASSSRMSSRPSPAQRTRRSRRRSRR